MTSSLNKILAIVLGVVFIAVGLLGFVLNPTLIVFGVNVTHDLVHLASGAALLIGAFAAGGQYVRRVNLAVGVVYLLVAAVGLLAPGLTDSLVNSGADSFAYADV